MNAKFFYYFSDDSIDKKKGFYIETKLKLKAMKFCPQCGTAFEPDARFCLECGFDKSTIEPVEVPVAEAENKVEHVKTEPACPQCGTTLVAGDRFCLECGFDTTKQVLSEPELLQPLPPPVVEELSKPEMPVNEPELPPVNKQFCSSCGSGISLDERFCQECGFDTLALKPVAESPFHPVEQPEVLFNSAQVPPLQASAPPPAAAKSPEPYIPPPPPLVRTPQPAYVPPVRTPDPAPRQKGKKTWLWILLAVIGLGALGAAGWYGYNRYLNTPVETTLDSVANMDVTELPAVDTSSVDMEMEETEPAEEVVPEPAKTTTKPMSRMDQELARQRAKQQNNQPQKSTTTAPAAKPDPGVKITSSTSSGTTSNIETKVILEIGRKEEPKNKNPKNPAKLQIQKPTMIVRITTDHYNDGMGTSGGGTITIKDRDGNVIGTFKASGKSGKNGTPNAKWVAQPNKMLEKGTYFIWDSDMPTWSRNFVGNGFVIVEGYTVE